MRRICLVSLKRRDFFDVTKWGLHKMSLTNQALVTGASEGIGRSLSIKLAQNGYAVTLVARNESRLNELLKELPGVGHQKLVADLSLAAGVNLVTEALKKGRYRVLVNNAGFGYLGDFREQKLELLTQMVNLNVLALVQLSHVFLNQSQKGDVLVNVASTLSFLPMPVQSVYAATKAFVTSFSESLWYQQSKRGVHVINLCPGITATQFNTRAGGDKRRLPSSLTQTSEEVVELLYRAIVDRKGPTIVSGWKNMLVTFLPRLLPRKWMIHLMGRIRQ